MYYVCWIVSVVVSKLSRRGIIVSKKIRPWMGCYFVSLLREDGYEGVSLISINDTWSAMRIKPVRENQLLVYGFIINCGQRDL